jgi:hypothetical protein
MEPIKPDKKMLKAVKAQNKALKEASPYKEEALIFEDRTAVSSNDIIAALNKG